MEQQYQRTIDFAQRVVYGLDMAFDRTRVGVVTYGTQAKMQFGLNKYRTKREVINALSFNPNRGRTNTQEAISMMRRDLFKSSSGDRPGVQNVAVLVSDGYSNVNQYNTVPEAGRAKNQGVAMYVVAIGDNVDMGEVNAMAGKSNEPPDSYVFRIRRDSEINRVADDLLDALCQ